MTTQIHAPLYDAASFTTIQRLLSGLDVTIDISTTDQGIFLGGEDARKAFKLIRKQAIIWKKNDIKEQLERVVERLKSHRSRSDRPKSYASHVGDEDTNNLATIFMLEAMGKGLNLQLEELRGATEFLEDKETEWDGTWCLSCGQLIELEQLIRRPGAICCMECDPRN